MARCACDVLPKIGDGKDMAETKMKTKNETNRHCEITSINYFFSFKFFVFFSFFSFLCNKFYHNLKRTKPRFAVPKIDGGRGTPQPTNQPRGSSDAQDLRCFVESCETSMEELFFGEFWEAK